MTGHQKEILEDIKLVRQDNLQGGVLTMTKDQELELMCNLALTKDREESISLAMQLFPEMTRERAAEVTDRILGTDKPM